MTKVITKGELVNDSIQLHREKQVERLEFIFNKIHEIKENRNHKLNELKELILQRHYLNEDYTTWEDKVIEYEYKDWIKTVSSIVSENKEIKELVDLVWLWRVQDCSSIEDSQEFMESKEKYDRLVKWKRNLPEHLKYGIHPINFTNRQVQDLETHKELVKRMKRDGITNMLYKIQGYVDDDRFHEPEYWNGKIGGNDGLIEINGKVYTNETIWSENKNQYTEIIWYNLTGLSDRDLPENIHDNSFMSMNETGCEFISITEDEFDELMENKRTLTDEQIKSPIDIEPELFPMIRNLGYEETKNQIERDIKDLQDTLEKLSYYKDYEGSSWNKSTWSWVLNFTSPPFVIVFFIIFMVGRDTPHLSFIFRI